MKIKKIVSRFSIRSSYFQEMNHLFTHNYFATVGYRILLFLIDSTSVNLQRKVVEVLDSAGNKQKVDLHIWDTAGQEKFFSLTKSKKHVVGLY